MNATVFQKKPPPESILYQVNSGQLMFPQSMSMIQLQNPSLTISMARESLVDGLERLQTL